jgi:enoyl-CoA hydratase/carnithine racemase
MAEQVRFEVEDGGVGVVTLDRPDKLNALDYATFEGLHEAAAAAAAAAMDGRVRAVLVIGAGRAFSAGLDVSLFGEQAAAGGIGDDRIAWLQQAFTGFEDLPVPTVAALRGPVLGGGLQLALACHLRVAVADVSLGLLEARWGLIPDLGATYRLPRLVGLSRAIDLAVSARTIDAATAHAWGLVDELFASDDLLTHARAYTARLASGPTAATGAVPALMREALSSSREEALGAERAAQAGFLSSDDFRAAVSAALQGRTPEFRGR